VNAALDNLVSTGTLKREASSNAELARFLAHADRAIADAGVKEVSASGRFEFAYTASHALAALRANGYRPGDGRGHRAVVFQTLVHTIGASDVLSSTLNRYHTRRNKSEYFAFQEPTEPEANELRALAMQLRSDVVAWLARHPVGGKPTRKR
jgi:hypothetical protein